MYLTFSEYAAYGGTITDEATFNDLEFEASTVVDWYTFSRLKNETAYPDALKRCMYKIIQFIQVQMAASGIVPSDSSNSGAVVGVTSYSNDGVSVSYNVLSAHDAVENSESQIAQIIRQYLANVTNSLGHKLLYRGIYPDE